MELGMILTSLWLGILTSISPCPLTTNITAVSYLSKKISKPWFVLLSGLFYTLGRAILYTSLGLILSISLSSIPLVSQFLQSNMSYILAPVLIVVGLMILDVIKLKLPKISMNDKSQQAIEKRGFLGALLLGFIFALALCPVSAALFLGNLIQTKGNVFALIFYGLGTGLPVLLISFILAYSVNNISKVYNKITIFEKWVTKVTGGIFILAGLYLLIEIL